MTAEIIGSPEQGGKERLHVGRPIYITAVFDTETILKKYVGSTNPNAPKQVDYWDPNVLHLMTSSGSLVTDQAKPSLVVKANVNDIINWRGVSLSQNTGQAAVIYSIIGVSTAYLETPEPIITRPSIPVPNLGLSGGQDHYASPYPFKLETVPDFYWHSMVKAHGYTYYYIHFYIVVAQETGGYQQYFFKWDPRIDVLSPV